MADGVDGVTGTWRKAEFVLWTDVTIPVLGMLVWFGLLVLAIAIFLAAAKSHGGPPSNLMGQLSQLMRSPMGIQAATASLDIVLLFFFWRILRRVGAGALVARFAAVRMPVILFTAFAGLAMAVGVLIANWQLSVHSIVRFHPVASERLIGPGSPYQYPVIFLTLAIIAPLAEEIYFRGIVYSWLSRKIFLVPAAFVSAFFFALVHFRFTDHPGIEGLYLTGVIGLVGLINAALAAQTRSLWPPIVFHGCYNASLYGVVLAAPLLGI
jgi:membrane protease YdiL (CAAX protease family)